VAGSTGSTGHALVKQLGLKTTANAADADVLLIDSLPVYIRQQKSLDALVKNGKTAVFLQPLSGSFTLDDDTVTVFKTIMGQYYFVSPVLDHPMMKAFHPKDFFFWFNSRKGLVSPILSEMSQGKGWTPLLRTGQTGWVGVNDYAVAAAEKRSGKGVYRINHVQLDGRLNHNPAARLFAQILFETTQ
jgi:hypothetical protein